MTSKWARWRLKSPASRLYTKKASKLRVTGLCAGNSPGTGEFPAQMASNAENVSIKWRHHENFRASDHFSDVTIMSCRPWTRPIIPEFDNIMTYYNDIIWAMASNITSNSTGCQELDQAKIKDIKLWITGPLWGESNGDWWIHNVGQ